MEVSFIQIKYNKIWESGSANVFKEVFVRLDSIRKGGVLSVVKDVMFIFVSRWKEDWYKVEVHRLRDMYIGCFGVSIPNGDVVVSNWRLDTEERLVVNGWCFRDEVVPYSVVGWSLWNQVVSNPHQEGAQEVTWGMPLLRVQYVGSSRVRPTPQTPLVKPLPALDRL